MGLECGSRFHKSRDAELKLVSDGLSIDSIRAPFAVLFIASESAVCGGPSLCVRCRKVYGKALCSSLALQLCYKPPTICLNIRSADAGMRGAFLLTFAPRSARRRPNTQTGGRRFCALSFSLSVCVRARARSCTSRARVCVQ